MKKVIGVILAGGEGKRLRPLTKIWPKPMLKVGRKSIIERQIDQLFDAGCEWIVVLAGYKGEKLRKHIYKKYPKNVYVIIEREKLGTGGCLKQLKPLLFDDHIIIVMNGDIVHDVDIEKAVDLYYVCNADIMITGVLSFEAQHYGRIELDDNGYVKRFLEKDKNITEGIVSLGLYVMNKKFIDSVNLLSLEEYFSLYSVHNDMRVLPYSGHWSDVGTWSRYIKENIRQIFKG